MPMQVCANRPCIALVAVPERFCAGCKAQGAGKDQRPSAAKRMYDGRWRRATAAYLAANPVAVDYFQCHNGKAYAAEVVDHIVPHRGDWKLFWDQANWQGLTKADHSRKTALEDGGFGRPRGRG